MNSQQYKKMNIVYNFNGYMRDGRYFSRRYFEKKPDGSLVEFTDIDDIESIIAFSDCNAEANERTAFRNHTERRFR